MTGPEYLARPIAEARTTDAPRYGMAADGYTLRSGAPTCRMIRLDGCKRWRRVMAWQFSNAGTLFIRLGGVPHIIRPESIPEASEWPAN